MRSTIFIRTAAAIMLLLVAAINALPRFPKVEQRTNAANRRSIFRPAFHNETQIARPPNYEDFTFDDMSEEQGQQIIAEFKKLRASGLSILEIVQPMQDFFANVWPYHEFDIQAGMFTFSKGEQVYHKDDYLPSEPLFYYYSGSEYPPYNPEWLVAYGLGKPIASSLTDLPKPNDAAMASHHKQSSFEVPPGILNLVNVNYPEDEVELLINVERACFKKHPTYPLDGVITTYNYLDAYYLDGVYSSGFNYNSMGGTADSADFAVSYAPTIARFISFYDETTKFAFTLSLHSNNITAASNKPHDRELANRIKLRDIQCGD